MTPIEPTVYEGDRLITFAKDQQPYRALTVTVDQEGLVTSEWEPDADELYRLLQGGRVRLRVMTFDPHLGLPGHRLQPVALDVVDGDGVQES